jgi:GTPase SAR1 family protein
MGEGSYASQRDRLRAIISGVGSIAERCGAINAVRSLDALDRKLAEQRFNVVVVGEFKRGKTTFVNALLGAEVLPAAVIPLTSVVTAVTWGDEIRAEITLLDGRVEEIPPVELARYVTERGNPENSLGVRRAVLSFPAEQLRDGVFLVDTPGVGSIYAHNTETARAFIREADVAIFLTSADPPISAAELEFLEEVDGETVELFFVLNKVDYLNEPDRAEALGFTEQVLTRTLGRDVMVYPVSARSALEAKLENDPVRLRESGLAGFELDFHEFLLRDKGRTVLTSAKDRALRVVADLRNSVDIEERTEQLSERDLADRLQQLETVFDRARAWSGDLAVLLKKETDALLKVVEEDLARLRSAEEIALSRLATSALAETEDLRTAATWLDGLLKSRLRTDLESWRRGEERKIAEAFRRATDRFIDVAERTVAETIRLSGDILGIRLADGSERLELAGESRFTYAFFEAPTILESILPDLRGYLPKTMARRLLLRDVASRIPRLVDKHCGRLRWDFSQRLDGSRITLERELTGRVSDVIESLTSGVGRARQQRDIGSAGARAARERAVELRAELDTKSAELGADPSAQGARR